MVLSLQQLVQWVLVYRYQVLLPAAVVEGPIVAILGGFFVSLGYFNVYLVYLTLIVGDVIGDSLYFGLGVRGQKFLEKRGHYIGVTPERMERLNNHFKDHTGKTLIVGKWSHVVATPVMVGAGLAKVPFRKFILFSLVGTVPKTLLLMAFGYWFGSAYATYSHYITEAGIVIAAFLLLLAVGFILMRKIGREYDI